MRPHVLLVEDHPALRTFVALALEPLALELAVCETVAAARAWIGAHGQPDLLLTDLMLPGESGIDLVRELRRHEPGDRELPVLVMTAGAKPADERALADLAVRRVLVKPVPVDELVEAVRSALSESRATRRGDTDAVVDERFGGDRTLFDAFQASCQAQFESDLCLGEDALRRGDWPSLQRLAHSLKSVLLLLGDSEGSEAAHRLESCCSERRVAPAAALWRSLRDVLQRHVAPR